jgi:hypothetical protein
MGRAPAILSRSFCCVVRTPIESGDVSDHTRSLGGEQLDDGIVYTFVSVTHLARLRPSQSVSIP